MRAHDVYAAWQPLARTRSTRFAAAVYAATLASGSSARSPLRIHDQAAVQRWTSPTCYFYNTPSIYLRIIRRDGHAAPRPSPRGADGAAVAGLHRRRRRRTGARHRRQYGDLLRRQYGAAAAAALSGAIASRLLHEYFAARPRTWRVADAP